MKRIYTDRSRIEEAQRCLRRRWLTYHQDGMGVVPARKNLALAVGGSVHVGLAVALRNGQHALDNYGWDRWEWCLKEIEERAVEASLTDFAQVAGLGLELEPTESAAMQQTEESERQRSEMLAQAKELGLSTEGLGVDRVQAMGEFERMLYAEQAALVEGMVRAYCRRRMRPLLEQFEVLEVEREGEWKLSEVPHDWVGAGYHSTFMGMTTPMEDEVDGPEHCRVCGMTKVDYVTKEDSGICYELWFMSRPDALLRERESNELYLLSFKTAAGWDVRKARSIEVDMQGLSEGVEVERRLGEWWKVIHSGEKLSVEQYTQLHKECSPSMATFLSGLPSPPRIHAIRYEFPLKGERWEDKELSARLGMTVRTQRSHLIRQYVAMSVPKKGDGGYSVGDKCWSWDYKRVEDDKDSKLSWQNWHGSQVDNVKQWIDLLDQSELLMSGEDSTVGLEPRVLGWKSAAQAMGVTAQHPLDAVFLPPVVVYRSDDQLRDWIEQIESQERAVAEHVAEVEAAQDAGERHSLLNRYFPQARHSCCYPSQCQFLGTVCFAANSEAEASPMSTGKFVARKPNHPQELVGIESK